MISQFITILEKAELQPNAEELADVFWLALQMGEPVIEKPLDADNEKAIDNQINDNEPPLEDTEPDQQEDKPNEDNSSSKQQANNPQLFPHQQHSGGVGSGIKGQAFRTPAFALLHNSLAFNRALRPLRKKVASRFHTELAIDETVQQIAETGLFLPVLVGKPQRWLELVMVIDDAISMRLWQPLLKEFCRLLASQGTFQKIYVYQLDTVNDDVRLLKNNRQIKHFEVTNPQQPRVIWVLSDCVAKAWHSNDGVFKLLQDWSRQHPVSIMQMLPYRLWKGTALGYAEDARFTAPLCLGLNQKLNLDKQDFWFVDDTDSLDAGFKIPVLTLEPEVVKSWTSLVLGKKASWLKGVVFEDSAAFIPLLAQESVAEEAITAEQRLKQFRSFASPMAQELVAYLAAVPLDLSVMNVVQKLMLPQSSQVHLAEVFLGGLLKRVENHLWLEYEFHEGVRELLLDSVLVADAVYVLTRVSEFIDKRFGQSLDFLALLANPDLTEGIELNEETRPFAEVGAKILRRLGGEYEALVKKIEGEESVFVEDSVEAKKYQLTKLAQTLKAYLTLSLTPKMIWLKGGKFMMGSPESEPERFEDERRHEVEVTDFAIGQYQLTFDEYDLFCQMTGRNLVDDRGRGRGRGPIISVSCFDAMDYCEWLSAQTGHEYRLPTEAEWEYACRAGTTTLYYFGDNKADLTKYAWYEKNSKGQSHPVGEKLANDFGLYDMNGNVWEWTASQYEKIYKGKEREILSKSNVQSMLPVLRGGSWYGKAQGLRSANRYRLNANKRFHNVGFRLVRM